MCSTLTVYDVLGWVALVILGGFFSTLTVRWVFDPSLVRSGNLTRTNRPYK